MATQVKLRQLHSEVSAKWTENADAIAAEETRATNAEAVLTSNLATEISDRQAAVTAEASARSSADTTLQSNIDAEAASRASADTTLQGNIDTEEARAVAAEGVLTTNLAQEVSDREAAMTAEASARSSADTTLQSNIDAEAAARAAADVALESSLKGDVAEGYNTLGKLEDKIQVEEGRVDAILDASQADKDSFAEIVTLINSVDTENDTAFANYVLSNDAALAAEISRAQSAEATIQADVDQNEADCDAGLASASADRAAIRSEFAAADSSLQSTLQGNIDTVESEASNDRAAVRSEFADADSTLQSNIDSEASSRAAEDVVLMNSLESMGFHQGSFAGSAAEMPLGENYGNVFPGSLSVFINGLEAQVEVDYSETEGALSVGGVASDDRVSFRYMFKSFESLSGNDGGGEELGGGDGGGEEGGGDGPKLSEQSVAYQNGWYAAAAGDPRSAVTDTPEEEGAWYDGYDAFMADPGQYSDYTP
jgi:hypothetical protein